MQESTITIISISGIIILVITLFYYHKHKSNKLMHNIELTVEKIVPYALLVLIILLVLEIFFKDIANNYLNYIRATDYLITAIFVVDLSFKYIYSRKIKSFVKTNWMDIIAVLPFMLIFRLFEELSILVKIGSNIKEAEELLETGIETGKKISGVSDIEKEASHTAKNLKHPKSAVRLSRSANFSRYLRIFARFPRLTKAVSFYEHPNHRKKT